MALAPQSELEQALTLEPLARGSYGCHLDMAWAQGPGVYGGIQAALMLSAMDDVVDDPLRSPRTLTVHFARRARGGAGRVQVEVVRQGRVLTHLRASLFCDQQEVATAIGTFAAARDQVGLDRAPPAPHVPDWDSLSETQHGMIPPVFTSKLAFRDVFGTPFTGKATAELGGWGRFVDPSPMNPAHVVALIDAWAPAALACFESPVPGASVDLSIHLHHGASPLPELDGTPCLFYAKSEAITDGYSEERASLWSVDGRLLATCRQNIVIFK